MVKVAPGIHTMPSAGGMVGAAGSGARSLTDTACSCDALSHAVYLHTCWVTGQQYINAGWHGLPCASPRLGGAVACVICRWNPSSRSGPAGGKQRLRCRCEAFIEPSAADG